MEIIGTRIEGRFPNTFSLPNVIYFLVSYLVSSLYFKVTSHGCIVCLRFSLWDYDLQWL